MSDAAEERDDITVIEPRVRSKRVQVRRVPQPDGSMKYFDAAGNEVEAHDGRTRRVKVVDPQTGEVKGEATHGQVLQGLVKSAGIVAAVIDGKHRRDEWRKCLCGEVFSVPPVRDWKSRPGRLPKRCPTCRDASKRCCVCGAESSLASQKRAIPAQAYCAEHQPTGVGVMRSSPPCAACGRPAHSPAKARHAAAKGRRVYCGEHRGGVPNESAKRRCEACGVPIKGKRWCNAHKHAVRRKARLPCAVCGKPSDQTCARKKSAPYCDEHRGGTGRGQFRRGQLPKQGPEARQKAWETRRRNGEP